MAVVCQAYVEGVSTRRVDDLVKAMGVEGISKSEVSRMAAQLDAKVDEFRERPLDSGPYCYLWIDALTQRVREGGRVVNVPVVIATATNAEGQREIVTGVKCILFRRLSCCIALPQRPSSAPPTGTSSERAPPCEGTECISPQPVNWAADGTRRASPTPNNRVDRPLNRRPRPQGTRTALSHETREHHRSRQHGLGR